MKYFRKENLYLQDLIDNFFEELKICNVENFNGELSVILLGSLSRGEATWIENDEGIKLISDIEFFTVYPDGFSKFADFTNCIKNAQMKVFGTQNSSLFHIDNTFVKRSSLSKLERKLITYDAKCMGKTVVGIDYLNLIPEITIDNINFWDIKDILTHRVFFVLYYGEKMSDKENNPEYRYLIAKNSLDLMTVLMVYNKKLASGFINRLEIIKELDISKEWKRYFGYCLSIKLSEAEEELYTIREMEDLFISIVKYLKNNFKVPLRNTFVNRERVIRRCMGAIKRLIKTKNIIWFGHLNRLVKLFERKQKLNLKIIKDNYVLNGYPEIKGENFE